MEHDEGLIIEFLDKKYRYSKSYHTKQTYNISVRRFQRFLRTGYNRSLDEIIGSVKEKTIDPIDLIDKYYSVLGSTNTKGESLSNSSIRTHLIVAKEFLNCHGAHIYQEDLKKRIKLPKKECLYEEGLTKEVIVRVLQNCAPKLRTAILMCASSGMRLGELVQLKTSDVDFDSNPTLIRIRRETTKTNESRFTYITSEATKTLKDYLRRTVGRTGSGDEGRYLFLKNNRNYDQNNYDKAVVSSKVSLIQSLHRLVDSVPELAKKNENGRNSIHFHAFRAWFKTQVTDAHESDFAEALMGHKSLKLVYYRQNKDARTEVYRKVESSLIISDITNVEKNLKEVVKKQQHLEVEVKNLKEYCNTYGIPVPESLVHTSTIT